VNRPDRLALVESADLPLSERLAAAGAVIDHPGSPPEMFRLIDVLKRLAETTSAEESTAHLALLLGCAYRAVQDDEQAYVHLIDAVRAAGRLNESMRGTIVHKFAYCAMALRREQHALGLLRDVSAGKYWGSAAAAATSWLLRSSGDLAGSFEALTRGIEVEPSPGEGRAELLRQRGIAREYSGDIEAAVQDFTAAANQLGENCSPAARLLACSSLSVGLLKSSRLDEAARIADMAIELAKASESGQALAGALATRGNVCNASGQKRLAIRYYHAALIENAKIGLRESEVILLNNIAMCYMAAGQPRLVSKYLTWALDSSQELGDRQWRALALMNMAAVSEPQAARGVYAEALELCVERGDEPGQAMALYGIGRSLDRLHEYEDALYFMNLAAETAQAAGALSAQIEMQRDIGSVYVHLGRPDVAWEHYERSWVAAEKLRRQTYAEAVQLELSRLARGSVGEAIALALAQQAEPANTVARLWRSRLFSMIDRSRARVLIDRMGAGPVASASLPQEVQEALAELAERVRRSQVLLGSDRSEGTPPREPLEQLRAELREAVSDFEEYEGFVAQSFPVYRSFTSTEPIQEELLDASLGRSVGIIQYAAVGDELVSVARVNGEFTVHHHGSLTEITALDREMTETCRRGTNSEDQTLEAPSRRLCQHLLSPIESVDGMAEVSGLIVVPAPEVFGFPLEALRRGDGFVFDRFTVSYLPSVSVARFLSRPPGRYDPALVMADPDSTLLSSRREAEEILRLIPGVAGRDPFLGPAATKPEFLRWAPKAGLIHLASHADFTAEAAAFSSITFAGESGESGTPDLEVRDLLSVKLRADLTVLSGCDTGLASAAGASEMIGFVRAFLASGSCAVLATRWPVFDRATSTFMRSFYEYLIGARLHPLDAIKLARHDLMSIRRYRNPVFWAAFTYFGLPSEWAYPRESALAADPS
jgi:CHAT domain-containing protein